MLILISCCVIKSFIEMFNAIKKTDTFSRTSLAIGA